MRVLFRSQKGKVLRPVNPANPMPTVTVCFERCDSDSDLQPFGPPCAATSGSPKQGMLPTGLHPAAESEESTVRELFSQHIELRAETQTVECLHGVIKRMTMARQALLQETMETPSQLTQECTQLVDTMARR